MVEHHPISAKDPPSHLQEDSARDDEEVKDDFWAITGEFIYRHHVVPRVKLYVPKEESFPIPSKFFRRYPNNTYVPGCIVGKRR